MSRKYIGRIQDGRDYLGSFLKASPHGRDSLSADALAAAAADADPVTRLVLGWLTGKRRRRLTPTLQFHDREGS